MVSNGIPGVNMFRGSDDRYFPAGLAVPYLRLLSLS
jgi:hypothetical protein